MKAVELLMAESLLSSSTTAERKSSFVTILYHFISVRSPFKYISFLFKVPSWYVTWQPVFSQTRGGQLCERTCWFNPPHLVPVGKRREYFPSFSLFRHDFVHLWRPTWVPTYWQMHFKIVHKITLFIYFCMILYRVGDSLSEATKSFSSLSAHVLCTLLEGILI